MLDQVTNVSEVLSAVKEVKKDAIANAVWRGVLSCVGSGVQLQIRRIAAEENKTAEQEALGCAEQAKPGEMGFGIEPREVDTSAFDARMNAVKWIIVNAGVSAKRVREEGVSALQWLATRRETQGKQADLSDLTELGLDAETIEAGRKLSERWERARSEERAEIAKDIGPGIVNELIAVCDDEVKFDLSVPELGLVVDMLGKAVHSAMIGATARVHASSWSPRRKGEAISELAGLTAARDALERIEVPDARDLVSNDRDIW
jgi:hypothetical protein